MARMGGILAFLAALVVASPVAAQGVSWRCLRANGTSCGTVDLGNRSLRQILILPTGFSEAERDTFWSEYQRIVTLATGPEAGRAWTAQRKDQLLFVGVFIAGGPLGSGALFSGRIAPHPVRGFATALDQAAVRTRVDAIRATLPALSPLAVGVLFNSMQTGVTANAGPPSFSGSPYGIARFTRQHLASRGAYIVSHELAHAGLDFLDEYIEAGFESMSIRQLDVLTPLLLFDGTWAGFTAAISDLLGVYDYNLSEILGNNGHDNIALSIWPASVLSIVPFSGLYPYEHGMFFGRGTYHQAGKNLMNGDDLPRAADDGFAFEHTEGQKQVIASAFGGSVGRANDRLRAAGPKNGWPLTFGSTTRILMLDGDKNHQFHPTRGYDVQVGWYDRRWRTCWWGILPYPCYDDVWTTAQRSLVPTVRTLDLGMSSAFGLATFVQRVICGAGLEAAVGAAALCQQSLATSASAFLPTLEFRTPYQDSIVPATQWLTTYWWRFRTNNGAFYSGWTGWSSFFRSL